MLRARKITIPPRFLNMALKDDNPVPEIRNKNVVTSIWVCPTFGMYLSNTGGSTIYGRKERKGVGGGL